MNEAERIFEEELRTALVADREQAGSLTPGDIRARAARRHPGWRWGGVGLLAAAVGLWVVLPQADQRDKGAGMLAPQLDLSVVVDGPNGPRPIEDQRVHEDGALVFFVASDRPGTLTIRERGGPVLFGADGSWRVEAGESVPGGDRPLAWRPDAPTVGARVYEAELCDDFGHCTVEAVTVEWYR